MDQEASTDGKNCRRLESVRGNLTATNADSAKPPQTCQTDC